MVLRTKINDAMKEAMKSKDQVALSTLRLVMAALKDRDISARGTGNNEGIADTDILSLLQGMIKQRQESAKIYCDAGREELAEREESEIAIIQSFLPPQLSDTEAQQNIQTLITELGATNIKDMGRVMASVKEKFAGQMDMTKASGIVKGLLS